ncbi:MAG: hypothetical protein HZC55_19360 [Verrucomicrobia bacterium]|nr:hypothetical protein [Verrucomicrobiota bacterium]
MNPATVAPLTVATTFSGCASAAYKLALSVTIAPDRAIQGSRSFRISPGPERFNLHFHAAEGGDMAAVDLAPRSALQPAGWSPVADAA